MPGQLTEFLDNLFTTTWYQMHDSAVDNIYDATPFWFWMRNKGRLTTQRGGRFLTESLRYAKSENVAWVGRGSTMPMNDYEFLTVATFPWRYLADSIVRFGVDEQQNAGASQIMDYAQAKLENSQESQIDTLEKALFTAQAGIAINGLPDLVNDTGIGVVGGIDAGLAENAWWKNQFIDATGKSMASFLIPFMRTLLNRCMNNLAMDAPDILVTTQTIYEAYEDGVVEQKMIVNKTLGDAGFQNIEYKGVPMVWSPSAEAGKLRALNTKFLSFKYDPAYYFDMTEWKAIPNQINDRVAQVLTAGNLITSRRRCQGVITGLLTE